MFIFWILLIIAAVWIIKEVGASSTHSDSRQRIDRDRIDPQNLARRRLARGEISREEFEEIMSTLEGY